jgi:hypothetical protein
MKTQDLAYYQGEIAQELRRKGMTDMQALLTSQWITEQIVVPAVRAERIRIEGEIRNVSLIRTDTLGEVGICDLILTSI